MTVDIDVKVAPTITTTNPGRKNILASSIYLLSRRNDIPEMGSGKHAGKRRGQQQTLGQQYGVAR